MRIFNNRESQKFTGEQIEDHLFLVWLFAVTYSIDIPFIEIYEIKKTKEIMYRYFIAEKNGSYTKDAYIKQQEVTIDFFKKYDYFLIYHPKYIYMIMTMIAHQIIILGRNLKSSLPKR